MKLPHRRQFLHLAAGAAALPVVSLPAAALDYPTRPVRILVGFPGGSSSDVGARLIGQPLSQRLGQQIFIENRPGAASNLAAEAVVRAPPDGYTLLLFDTVNAINATLYTNLNFDLIHDIVPVASITRGPGLMVVNPKFPAKSVPEFIAYAKANPGQINMATAGSGSMLDVYGELFMMMAGVDMLRVPYQTAVEPCALRYAASAHKSSIVGSNAPVTPGFAAASLSRLTWRCTRPTRYGFALNSGRGPLAVRTAAQYDYLEKIDGFPDWDRVPPYEACPFEYKRADWGCLNGRLVAVDYSAPKLF